MRLRQAANAENFNCTIQELKQGIKDRGGLSILPFQLHHTGIKTCHTDDYNAYRRKFQLHHTGIKTHRPRGAGDKRRNFNCTIQELKRTL